MIGQTLRRITGSKSRDSFSKQISKSRGPNSFLRIGFGTRRNMAVSAIDSRIFRSLFGTEEIRKVSLLEIYS
jgi:hypothetical protein